MIQISSANLLATLASLLPEKPVIVEAGAFTGNDTRKIAENFPQATIHAFEPLPEIYAELLKNTQHLPNIKTYPLALSCSTGVAVFHIASHPKRPGKICQAGSLLAPLERLAHSPITYPETTTVPTITLDYWAQQNGISKIDFLWLDMQGHELAALSSSTIILQTVSYIYMEINFIPAYQGQPASEEIHEWLSSQGFRLIGTDYKEKPTHFFGNHLYSKIHN